MAYSPSRQSQSDHTAGRPSSKPTEMAMLAATPTPHAGFQKEYPWDSSRIPSYPPQPSQPASSVSLPSIRHQFPDLLSQDPAFNRPADSSVGPTATGPANSPSYVHSPGSAKRRRGSFEDDQERERARQVPRLYQGTGAEAPSLHRPLSPVSRPPPSTDGWTAPARTSPFSSARSSVPAPVEVVDRVEPRPSLPGIHPSLGMDRTSASRPPTRDHPVDDYRDSRRTAPMQQRPSVSESTSRYPPASYDYSYRHPSHVPATSPTHHTYERTYEQRSPFSTGPYSHSYQDYGRYGDLGHMGMVSDSKQRKRRGNLPKETTDKLRSWFLNHLTHPYPTEDEKQDLMRQTGLQMNQISNWFINARRRQLPTMINNARVESDAMSGRGADGKVLPSTERPDIRGKREGLALSDGEGAAYDEDLESLKQHRAPTMARGSV